jgi:hypothetical protein
MHSIEFDIGRFGFALFSLDKEDRRMGFNTETDWDGTYIVAIDLYFFSIILTAEKKENNP